MLFPSCKVFWGLWYRIYTFEDLPKNPISGGISFVLSHAGGGVSDLAQYETSRSCQRPVEMVRRQGWNDWWCDRERKAIIPYVLMVEMFRNGIGLLIVCASTFEICPILLWMYIRNVSMYHRLSSWWWCCLPHAASETYPPMLWESGIWLGPGWCWRGEVWGRRWRIEWRLWDLLVWTWQRDHWLLHFTHRYTIMCCHRCQGCDESNVLGPCKDIGWW